MTPREPPLGEGPDDDMYVQEQTEARQTRRIWLVVVTVVLGIMAGGAWDMSQGGCFLAYAAANISSGRYSGSARRSRSYQELVECRSMWASNNQPLSPEEEAERQQELRNEERFSERSRIAESAADLVRSSCRAGRYSKAWPPSLANLAKLSIKNKLTAKYCDCVAGVHQQRLEGTMFEEGTTEKDVRAHYLAPETFTADLADASVQERIDNCIRPSILVRTGEDP